MTPDEWRKEYRAAFVRIGVERGYWDAAGAQVWADNTDHDAHAAASEYPPAEVAEMDVEMCARERE